MARLNSADRKLLGIIQTGFPVERHPYQRLAESLGMTAATVFQRVRHLQKDGSIRRLGAVFDAHRLGYVTTMVAASVPPDLFQSIIELIDQWPQVTHSYRRDHVLNLWFTLTGEAPREIDDLIERMRLQTGLRQVFQVPACTVFKRQVVSGLGGENALPGHRSASADNEQVDKLSHDQKQLVRLLQPDLPAVLEPFTKIAADMAQPVERVLGQIESWQESGIISRVGAVLIHSRLGYPVRALVVMTVPEEWVPASGTRLAAGADVTHVYERVTAPDWPYNLYAVVHGKTNSGIYGQAQRYAEECRATGFEVLFSTEEYKKAPMQYFAANG